MKIGNVPVLSLSTEGPTCLSIYRMNPQIPLVCCQLLHAGGLLQFPFRTALFHLPCPEQKSSLLFLMPQLSRTTMHSLNLSLSCTWKHIGYIKYPIKIPYCLNRGGLEAYVVTMKGQQRWFSKISFFDTLKQNSGGDKWLCQIFQVLWRALRRKKEKGREVALYDQYL